MDLIVKKAMLGDKEAQWEIIQNNHLLPCPCCKSIFIRLRHSEKNYGKFYYECENCGTRTKDSSVKSYVRMLWNTRPQILTDEELKMIGVIK